MIQKQYVLLLTQVYFNVFGEYFTIFPHLKFVYFFFIFTFLPEIINDYFFHYRLYLLIVSDMGRLLAFISQYITHKLTEFLTLSILIFHLHMEMVSLDKFPAFYLTVLINISNTSSTMKMVSLPDF